MGHMHDNSGPEARRAVEAALPTTKWDEEVARGLDLGLPGADSIVDRRIPTSGAFPVLGGDHSASRLSWCTWPICSSPPPP
ncbi:hypothetical protein [Kutzneria sp. NPDC052558]|uniref:hypothetical protein n=1 Tax=Kutzneria sp. NPDC052558 TaxID=3364121 RepID=UPI0037C98AAA